MNDDDSQKPFDPKHRAFSLLTLGGPAFMFAAYKTILEENPGAAAEMTAKFRDGSANIGIYFEFNHDRMRAELALVPPEFGNHLEPALLRINGPIDAAFTPPESLSVTDLSKLN